MKRKQRPPQHEYIRHLVYERLPLGQVTKVSCGNPNRTGVQAGLQMLCWDRGSVRAEL